MIEQFRTIYFNKQDDKIISFLKGLTAKDKKEIVKELKQIQNNKKKFNSDIFWMTALACGTKTQFRTLTDWYQLKITERVDEVLAWYCPDWFSEVYNKAAEEDYWSFDIYYADLVRWQLKGYLQPSDRLIARSLSGAITYWDASLNKNIYNPEIVEQYPITLDEHIWTLFEQETNIAWTDSPSYDKKDENVDFWKNYFLKHGNSGRIDRLRLLRACLNTVIYDFKRDLAGWYADLFVFLKPTKEELLAIQDEMFATFMGKFPKMTNRVLDSIKEIAADKAFHLDDFISKADLLLSSEVKSIVNSTLVILDKAAKFHKDKQAEISICLPLVFLNKDESVQKRAAKMILQYGNTSSADLKEALSIYNSSILMSAKEMLKDFLDNSISNDDISVDEVTFEKVQVIDDSQLITVPQTIDDLIFFLPQIFENGESYQIDLLPAALLRLTKEITADNLNQLELPLHKAYEICLSKPFFHMFKHKTKEFEKTYFWGPGSYYNLAALFFVQYCQYLATLYPQSSAFIQDMHNSAVAADKEKAKKTKGGLFQYNRQISRILDWIFAEYKLFYAYHKVMVQALTFIESDVQLPLLSTPTHQPCWVAPDVLTERLLHYQQADHMPEPADMQLALARIAPESIPVLIDAVKSMDEKYSSLILSYYTEQQTTKEKKSLLSFFSKEKTSCTFSEIGKYIDTYSWKIADGKRKDVTYTERFVLDVSIPKSPWIGEDNHYAGISDRLRLCIGTQDVRNFVFSYPATPAIPFAMITKDRFEFAQIPDAEFRDFLMASVAALSDIKVQISSATSLFLACCMLCSEKTIRNYAAEIWIERTANGQIDNTEFGNNIGMLEKVEWAPIKRLTDQISDRMINISSVHNQALEAMIVAILSYIEQPITNLKKLLEIYSELLALNNSKANLEKVPQLNDWLKENSLKKVVQQILK